MAIQNKGEYFLFEIVILGLIYLYCIFRFSDVYRIQDEYGDTIADLSLNQIRQQSLVETFGLFRVLSSIALQRQEEVDIFFGDAV